MIIEIKVDICGSKYGSSLASSEMRIDSDHIEAEGVQAIVKGLVASALARAEVKQTPKTEALVITPPDGKEVF